MHVQSTSKRRNIKHPPQPSPITLGGTGEAEEDTYQRQLRQTNKQHKRNQSVGKQNVGGPSLIEPESSPTAEAKAHKHSKHSVHSKLATMKYDSDDDQKDQGMLGIHMLKSVTD
mmetsp:Transcript_32428/g.49613  ORF Transcript_32428/g.49613 Transcript_32428/m.49613 type:complete len:114 (-) Transcript_32428:289-630(-)